jgi:glycosyltransferase involved in cell wall biosynthesis
MVGICLLSHDPLEEYKEVGTLEHQTALYKEHLKMFDEVHVISPNDPSPPYKLHDEIFVHTFHAPRPFNLLAGIKLVSKLVENYDIRLIRAYDEHEMGFIASVCGRLKEIPSAASIHTDWRNFKKPNTMAYYYMRLLEKSTFKLADIILPISGYLRNIIVAHGCNPSKVEILPNRVDSELFKPLSKNEKLRRKLSIKKPVIAYVGRLSKDKMVMYFIKCAESFLERGDASFILIGDGPLREELESYVKTRGLSNKVVFTGSVAHETLPSYISIADIVVCPYSGNVLLEAASMGKPIVALDIEWHPEVIINNETGILVPPGDLNSCVEALIELLHNPEKMEKIGSNVRKLIVDGFSWKRVTEREQEIYKRLMSKNG